MTDAGDRSEPQTEPGRDPGAHGPARPALVEEQPDSAPAVRTLPAWAGVLVGLGAAVVGLLPWLVAGMRLPLQNLWAFETMPDRMPLVLLPFSQYALTSIVGLIVTGSVVAGLLARILRPRMPRLGFAGLVVGLLATQGVAVLQTAVTVNGGLRGGAESALYLTGLVALSVFSMLIGLLMFWLVARAPRAGALIGLSFGAIAVGFWLGTLLHPIGSVITYDTAWISAVLRWTPAILVGASIAWCGLGTAGRVIAAIASLVVLWIAPALATAVSAAVGSRVLARRLDEMLDYGIGVFTAASTIPELVFPPLIVAVVVAAVGLVARALLARRSRGREREPGDELG
ncbi:hypothetical protein [Agromyces salentinus]|uniref:Uncharacterized protein n=1 Tax=Agromyces salentinus TaxID=269421 RepID=A0ABN2MIE9_9MICO|nr:hypothetical protein [Agromyces salentinus]